MKAKVLLVFLIACAYSNAAELFREVLKLEAYERRVAEVLRLTDTRFLKIPPIPVNDFFVSAVTDQKKADPLKQWDRIILVNGKYPENTNSILYGNGKYSLIGHDGKERLVEIKKWPVGAAVFEKFDIQLRCLANSPRNERWNKHLFVAVHAGTRDIDLAETAFHHAIKSGMPENVSLQLFGAFVQLHKREFAIAAQLSQKCVKHADEVIAAQASQLHFWAAALSGQSPKPVENARFMPTISASEMQKAYGAFADKSKSANRASLDMRREDVLPQLESMMGQPFSKSVQEYLSKYKRYELVGAEGQGFYASRLKPYKDAFEFSAFIRFRPVTPGPMWFRRSFVIGFVPSVYQDNQREAVSRLGDYFGISFGERDIIFGHAYPQLNGGMMDESILKDMQNGSPHFFRMILAKGLFEVSVDGRSVYCAPVGKEFNSFAFIIQAEGMEYWVDQVNLNALISEPLEKTQLAIKEFEKKAAKGESALHAACREGSIAACRAAVSGKLDLDALDGMGRTPAEVACDHLQHQCALFLLQNGAKKTLQLAAMYGTVADVAELCKKDPGAVKTVKGNGPVHVAALRRNLEIVKLLIENGADVNAGTAKMYAANTPLHLAGMMNHFDMAKYLIEKGAKMDTRNALGKTPSEFTELMQGSKEMIELLTSGKSDARPVLPPRPPEDF